MIIRRPDKSCNQSDLRTHQSRNPKRTSGHLEVEILNGPLDTSKLANSNPTSGHQKKNERSRCPEVGLGSLGFMLRTLRRAQKSMQNILVFLAFEAHQEI